MHGSTQSGAWYIVVATEIQVLSSGTRSQSPAWLSPLVSCLTQVGHVTSPLHSCSLDSDMETEMLTSWAIVRIKERMGVNVFCKSYEVLSGGACEVTWVKVGKVRTHQISCLYGVNDCVLTLNTFL